MDLKVSLDEVENKIVVRLEGRLDVMSSSVLEKRLFALIQEKKNRLLIDFSRVDYLSSAGLRLLFSFAKRIKKEGGFLVLFSLGDDLLEIIKMAGFDRILTIRSSEREALEYEG